MSDLEFQSAETKQSRYFWAFLSKTNQFNG